MLNLPKSTEMNRPLSKKSIYEKFKLNTAAKERFDADIRRLAIVGEVSPATVNIGAGSEVTSFYVVHIALKTADYDAKNIGLIAKLIPQNLLFVLEYEGKAQLAVWRTKLLKTEWKPLAEHGLSLQGLNLDVVWQNIIVQVGGITLEQDNSLDEQIQVNAERERITKKIEQLERQAWAEKQPKKKFELAGEIQRLKSEMERSKE
jgi:hypothetical protein